MKTLRYRGADLRVKYECPHWFPLAKRGSWLIPDGEYIALYFIEGPDVVIEISETDGLHEDISKVVNYGELVEIVEFIEWQEECSDRCFFSKNGFILPHDAPLDTDNMALPVHVGFYRWERDREDASLLYHSFPTFDYLLLPVPIECIIRAPNAEEKLWMNCAAQMPSCRDQVIETEKEKRRRESYRDNVLASIYAFTRKLDEVTPQIADNQRKALVAMIRNAEFKCSESEKKAAILCAEGLSYPEIAKRLPHKNGKAMTREGVRQVLLRFETKAGQRGLFSRGTYRGDERNKSAANKPDEDGNEPKGS